MATRIWLLVLLSSPAYPSCLDYFPIVALERLVIPAQGKAKADVLFLTGFSDRPSNHRALFESWSRAGARVISFAYPGHGDTASLWGSGTLSLNLFSVPRLASLAFFIERFTREDVNRPLIIAGWSMGGLLALRMATIGLAHDRKISGLFLLAPGIGLQNLPGEWGVVTRRTLTQNQETAHLSPPKPASPFLAPAFALSLKWNSWVAQATDLPENLPTFILFADPNADVYVDTPAAIRWAKRQIALGRPVWGTVYKPETFHGMKGRHALDWEPEPIARDVRQLAADFVHHLGNLPEVFTEPHLYLSPTPPQ